MGWEIKVRKADNGYILEWEEDEADGEGTQTTQKVVAEPDTEDGKLEAMKDLLWEIKEHFGIFYSKHNHKNVNITIEETNKEDS